MFSVEFIPYFFSLPFSDLLHIHTDKPRVADLVCSDDAFSLFCKLLEMTGFDQVLDDPSITATVFAPNDEAFETDDLQTMETIFSSDENLEWVLLYHTILDQVMSSTELDCGVRVLMANERDTRTICSVLDNTIYQKGAGNDNSNQDNSRLPEIIDFNIDACNGIVHVVNKLILPRKLPSNHQQQHEADETEDDKHHDDAEHDDDDDDEHKPHDAHDGVDDDDDIIDDDGMEEHTSTPTTQPTFAFPEEDPNFDDDDDDHNNNHHSSDDNDDDHDNDHHSDENGHHEEDHEEDHDDDDDQHSQSPEPIEGKIDEAASCGDTIGKKFTMRYSVSIMIICFYVHAHTFILVTFYLFPMYVFIVQSLSRIPKL